MKEEHLLLLSDLQKLVNQVVFIDYIIIILGVDVMAVYVMSDLHGNYEGFMSILEQIKFSEEDELYVDGDIVDRGKGGIKILQYMMMQPNIYPIIGNHEYALMQVLDFVTQEITEDSISKIDEKTLQNIIEYQNIGGQVTLDDFQCFYAESEL